jgi:hypothetical protein
MSALKTILITLLLIFTSLTRADLRSDYIRKNPNCQPTSTSLVCNFALPNLGTLRLQVTDMHYPSDEPYQMAVQVLCTDHRSQRNLVSPTWEDLTSKRISQLDDIKWEPGAAKLSVQYCLSDRNSQEAGCKPDTHKWATYEMVRICEAWQR